MEQFSSPKLGEFGDGRYHPKPSIEHLFIAAYSCLAHVPVFTTNYDTMLEQACQDLGVRSRTLIFSETYEEIFRGTSFGGKIDIALENNKSGSKTQKDSFLDQIQSEVKGVEGQIVNMFLPRIKKSWY